MPIVSQNARLSDWKPEYSDLDIDYVPTKYNTLGKLGSLSPGASQLDFDGATPAVPNYFTGPEPSQGQESVTTLGFSGALPAPVDNFTNINANGFVLQAPIGVTQFINDGQTSIHGFASKLPAPVDYFLNTNSKGFILQAPIGVTQFVNNGQTSIHGFTGKLPPPVDYFINTYSNGFTIQNPIGVSQFVGINGNVYNNPSGIIINTTPGLAVSSANIYYNGFYIKNPIGTSQYKGIDKSYTKYTNPNTFNQIGSTVDYFNDVFSGAVGFKANLDPFETGYIGIDASKLKYEYPATVAGGRLFNVSLGPGAGTAKLDNQLGAGSKLGNTGFYSTNRYEAVIKNADNKSLLASWAIRRRSPSPLDNAYTYSTYYGHSLKLRDAAYNPTYMAHPLILRGMQRAGEVEPQRWGLTAGPNGQSAAGGLVAALDGGFIRGGITTAVERAAVDTARIAKFIASPRGIVWVATQIGLGKSNVRPHGSMPYAEIALATRNPLPLLNNTQTHLGLTSLLSVPGTAFGLHFTRHGIPFLNEVASYEYVLKRFTQSELDVPGTVFHKHLRLKDELLDLANPNLIPTGYPILNLSYVGGPQSVYGLGTTIIRRATDTLEGWKRFKPKSITRAATTSIAEAVNLFKLAELYKKLDIEFDPKYSISKQYAPELNNNETLQGNIQNSKNKGKELGNSNADWADSNSPIERSLGNKLKSIEDDNGDWIPGNGINADVPIKHLNTVRSNADPDSISGNNYASLPYTEIRRIARDRSNKSININDFRRDLVNSPDSQKTFSTNADIANYAENNLTTRYGFGDHGNPTTNRSNPYEKNNVNNLQYAYDKLQTGVHGLAEDPNFKGDKITATDYIKSTNVEDIYPNETRDFITFYFSGPKLGTGEEDDVILFRATVKSINDSFNPSWNPITIMGRPDSPAMYSTFERNVSFNFSVAATSREELIPMWRKLNYLGSYTMPVFGNSRPQGPITRLTIGNMFKRVPGYITSLSITVNDEATWDLADDSSFDQTGNISVRSAKPKQLPNIVDIDVNFAIIHDYRPQKGGRVYSLYDGNVTEKTAESSWLWDTVSN